MNTEELLKSRQLRLTKPRTSVLDAFQNKIGRAISIKELLAYFQKDIDKVTLYRTLHTFENNGLIHRVLDDTGVEKYALCVGTCDEHHDHELQDHGHIHFKCEQCQETECISDLQLPKIELPKGYQTRSRSYLIFGSCAKCS